MSELFEISMIAVIGGTFFLAGTVKGVIGLGLPTVSLALLTVALGLPEAMSLLLAPSFLTNFWQGTVGGNLVAILKRLWPFLLSATALVWVGGNALGQVDLAWLSALLGLLLIIYGGISLLGVRLTIRPLQEKWAGPLLGVTNGVLTGMTGSFVVPGVLYLQALGLPRDMLIQAMGVLFTLSTLALGMMLQSNAMITADLGLLSVAAVAPAILGMMLGQKLRARLPEQQFRRVFFAALLLLGVYIITNAL